MMHRVLRVGAYIALLLSVLVGLIGCSHSNTSSSSSVQKQTIQGGKPKLTYKGNITFFAQSYTPAAPGVKLTSGSVKLHEMEKLAKKFEAMYPNIHIKFVDPSFTDSNQDVQTLTAGGKMYDIYFNQFDNFNSVFPQGIVYDLKPYFEKPNPFIKGNKKWESIMNPDVLANQQAANGAVYELNGDYVGIQFFYNKNLYKKAGISEPPKTWSQLLQDCKKLKAHGITPGADVPTYDWWVRVFLGNSLGVSKLKQIANFDHQPGISEIDNAVAYNKGITDPTKNPAVMAWWPLVKQLYSYWDPNVTVIPWDNVPNGAQTGQKLFAAGKVAMVYNGTWVPNSVKGANNGKMPFSIGSFPFPSLAGTSKYATSYNSGGDAGGPQAAFQYAISTQKADQTMTPEKFQACLAWLQFISVPKHTQNIINELGSFVPTFKGTQPVPALKSVDKALHQPWYQEDGGQFFTAKEYTQVRNIFQEYVSGHLSLSQAKNQYNQAVSQGFHEYVIKNHVNFSKY